MTDIVERLRDTLYFEPDSDLPEEAAAEIERLRAEKQDAFDLGYRAAGGSIFPLPLKEGDREQILRAASEWRDISTAPRDGTWVLVASEDLYPCDAQWAETDLNTGWYDIGGFFSTQPTHWQPLPAPPQRSEVTK